MTMISDGQSRLLIRLEIEALNAEFAYRVDHFEGNGVENLFTPDGSYGVTGGGRSVGQDAIRESYDARRSRGPRTARHIFTNLRLHHVSPTEATGTTILVLFAEDGMPPLPANVLAVSDFEDNYRYSDGRWLYHSRTIHRQFQAEASVPVLPLGQNR
jgi:hypothetical protein